MAKNKAWTVREIEDLKALSVTYTPKELAELFDRSLKTIYWKLEQVGSNRDYKYFTKEEENKLVELLGTNLTKKEICKVLKRSRNSVNAKIKKLYSTTNLSYIRAVILEIKSSFHYKQYNKEEEDFIIQNYNKLGLKEVCKRLKRTEGAVRQYLIKKYGSSKYSHIQKISGSEILAPNIIKFGREYEPYSVSNGTKYRVIKNKIERGK